MAYFHTLAYRRLAHGPGARPGFIWDCLLGGTDHYPDDRIAAQMLRRLVPHLRREALANRAFRNRAALHLLRRGIRQFLDLGAGVPPCTGSLHRTLLAQAKGARIAYVDHDAKVVERIRAHLAGTDHTTALHADLRSPGGVLTSAEVLDLFDLSKPVAVITTNVLQALTDGDDPRGVLAAYRTALAPGSALVLSHPVSADLGPTQAEGLSRTFRDIGSRFILRTPDDVTALLGGFDIIPAHPSGATTAIPVDRWGTPDRPPVDNPRPGVRLLYGAVGILPGPDERHPR